MNTEEDITEIKQKIARKNKMPALVNAIVQSAGKNSMPYFWIYRIGCGVRKCLVPAEKCHDKIATTY